MHRVATAFSAEFAQFQPSGRIPLIFLRVVIAITTRGARHRYLFLHRLNLAFTNINFPGRFSP